MSTVLIIGGTGAMGARVALRLVERPDTTVVVLTRDPSSARARALVEAGGGRIAPVRGDLENQTDVVAAMGGVEQVFCNTDFFATASPWREYEQGIRVLGAAEEAGVDRFVWSSLDYAGVLTGGAVAVPHYDAKGAVEAHIGLRRSEEMMTKQADGWYSRHVAVLVTAPYFENFQFRMAPQRGVLPDGRDGIVFAIPLGAGRYPLIGLDDIAWFADHVLDHWDAWRGRTLRVVADSLTGDEIAATFEHVTGIPSSYLDVPHDDIRAAMPDIGHDLAAMFAFFAAVDVAADHRDLPHLRSVHPGLETFDAWLRRTGWDGSTREVQARPVQVAGRAAARP